MQIKDRKKFHTLDVVIISLVHHIHDIYTSFLAPIELVLRDKLGINHTMFGMLSVIQRIPSLLNPLIGIMAEKIKVRYAVIFAPSITAVSMSLMGIAPGYIFLAILLFISGFSSALFHIPTPVMIKQVSGKKTGRGMSFYMVGGELARTLGPIIITGAIDLWGFHGIFRLMPMGLVASLVLFLRFRNFDLRKNFTHAETTEGYRKTMRKFLPLFLTIAGILFTRGAMKASMTLYLKGYLELTGTSNWIAAIALSTVYLSGAAGTFISGTVSDKLGRRNTLLIISIISPLLMGLFIYLHGILIFPLLILIGIFLLATTPVMLAAIHETDTNHLPFVNGIFMTGNFLISSIMTVVVGYAFDKLGYETSFKLAALLALLAIPFALKVPEKKG
ncbi:MAG: MFS transporter [Bacteroidales bacterium]|nr:MFS transporter [Bacteroidales bacterium]